MNLAEVRRGEESEMSDRRNMGVLFRKGPLLHCIHGNALFPPFFDADVPAGTWYGGAGGALDQSGDGQDCLSGGY